MTSVASSGHQEEEAAAKGGQDLADEVAAAGKALNGEARTHAFMRTGTCVAVIMNSVVAKKLHVCCN